eukprot:Pgem_evm1s5763
MPSHKKTLLNQTNVTYEDVNFAAPEPLFFPETNQTLNFTYRYENLTVSGPGGGIQVLKGDYSGPPGLVGHGYGKEYNGNWPSITGLEFSSFSFVVNVCGIMAPHTHTNAHEYSTVIQGEAVAFSLGVNSYGFLQKNQIYANKIKVGDTVVFPAGSIHFIVNTGTSQYFAVGGFTATYPFTSLVADVVTPKLMPQEFVSAVFNPSMKIGNKDENGGLFPFMENVTQCKDAIQALLDLVD